MYTKIIDNEQLHNSIGVTGVGNNKLRTYATICNNEDGIETYLMSGLTWAQKRSIAKLRTGNHSLRIETGRHSRPRLPAEQRLCLTCNSNISIEDERHFISECSAYSDIRGRYLLRNSESGDAVNFIECMSVQHYGDLVQLAEYIKEAWIIREHVLT